MAGCRDNVSDRGNRRDAIIRTDTDRRRFPGRVAELPGRFGIEVHAFVIMDNHYHLPLRARDANPSEATRWLPVSYRCGFDRAHRVRGQLSEG